jgi:hypothetical protein
MSNYQQAVYTTRQWEIYDELIALNKRLCLANCLNAYYIQSDIDHLEAENREINRKK